MTTAHLCITLAILVYLGCMLYVGYRCSKNNNDSADFYLGGRKLGPLVTAMSAEASDMSSWLLMGLPGLAYLTGVADAGWTAIGLAIGTYLNWRIVAKRIRRYTHVAGNSITLPSFFSNRYRDEKKILQSIGAIFIVIFFIPYTASGFAACGKLFSSMFGINYQVAMVISALIIVGYTTLGGFLAASTTDFIQSIIMSIALVIVFIFGINVAGGVSAVVENAQSLPGYLTMHTTYDPVSGTEQPYPIISIVSMIAWGLGYFGQPHILTRFMAIKSSKDIKPARRIAMVWVIVSLAMAVLVGILASPYIQYMFKTGQITDPSSLSILNANGMLEGANTQKVFMVLVQNMFPTVIAGLLLSAVLAAIMSTADSQLLVASSSFSSDIYNTLFNKNASEKTLLNVSRITIVVVAIIACLLALDPNSSVFEIVAHAWAGFGAAFGPVILCSLFWKRCNEYGALAGVISGGAVALLWAYVPTAIWGADNLPGIFTVYEIIPGFIVSLALIFIVSLATKAPSKEVIEEFESVKTADV